MNEPLRPEAVEVFRRVDQRIAYEDAYEATQNSLRDLGSSYWACVAWTGRGKTRRPTEWRGYLNGLLCMSVRYSNQGLFLPFYYQGGKTVPCPPTRDGKEAQIVAFEGLLDSEPMQSCKTQYPEKPEFPEMTIFSSETLEVEA